MTTTRTRKTTAAKPSTPKKPTVKKAPAKPISTPPKPTKAAAKTATAPKASRAQRNATRVKNIKTLGSMLFFQQVAGLTGLSNIEVQDAGDGESFVMVWTDSPYTWTLIPSSGPGSSPTKFEVEVASDNDETMGMPDHHELGAVTPEDLAGEFVSLVHGGGKGKTPKPATRARRTDKPKATPGSMTQKQYDVRLKAIVDSDMGTRHKAAAKAVLTKQARDAGLEIVGSRKVTESMTPDEIAARRSEAAKRAVATRKANEAAAIAAAEKAKRPSRRKAS